MFVLLRYADIADQFYVLKGNGICELVYVAALLVAGLCSCRFWASLCKPGWV
jgi:hypothetical protein